MEFFAGIDAGSRAIKAALVNSDQQVVATGMVDQGIEQEVLAKQLFGSLLEPFGAVPEDVRGLIATGYGRNLIRFADTTVTEITCHAHGIRHAIPAVRTIIEIGGQDSKVIRLDGAGSVRDFSMNDRCAAGTGRFLEIVAHRLGIDLAALDRLAAQSREPAAISSMCAVFAETEIVGLLASGTPPPDIVAGVQISIAKRVGALAGRAVDEPVVFTGGVALLPGMAAALQTALGRTVTIPDHPQFTGAVGAALLAAREK